MSKPKVGGQAVIEGVMMRGYGKIATAVREPNGKISVEVKPVHSISDKYPILKKPFFRGSVSLFESLILGLKSLSYSAKMAGEEDEQLSDKELAGTIILALVLATVLFIAIPTGAANWFKSITNNPFTLNILEGVMRLIIFLLYLTAISQMKDIKRVFQYHGAEHKTIWCYESNEELTVENVQKYPRLHPRCGTSFLLIVMLVSIFVFAFLGWSELWERILSRLMLLPVVAGVSYELIRYSADSTNVLVKALAQPGLWLQYLTTKSPDNSMIEVAICSLKSVLPEDDKQEKNFLK